MCGWVGGWMGAACERCLPAAMASYAHQACCATGQTSAPVGCPPARPSTRSPNPQPAMPPTHLPTPPWHAQPTQQSWRPLQQLPSPTTAPRCRVGWAAWWGPRRPRLCSWVVCARRCLCAGSDGGSGRRGGSRAKTQRRLKSWASPSRHPPREARRREAGARRGAWRCRRCSSRPDPLLLPPPVAAASATWARCGVPGACSCCCWCCGAAAAIGRARAGRALEQAHATCVPPSPCCFLAAYTHPPRFGPLDGLEIGDMLGKGAFGKVFRGRWNGAVCAVKVVEHRVVTGARSKQLAWGSRPSRVECSKPQPRTDLRGRPSPPPHTHPHTAVRTHTRRGAVSRGGGARAHAEHERVAPQRGE